MSWSFPPPTTSFDLSLGGVNCLQLQNALDLMSISRKYLLLSVPTAALISR